MSPTPVPVGRADALARFVFAELRDRSEADRRLVFHALQRRLGVAEMTEKQEQAVEALRRVHARRGEWPSRRGYDEFRDDQPVRKDWPSSSFIRNAFGRSWPDAVAAAAGGAQVDVLARRLLAQGSAFMEGDVLAAVRRWADGREPPLRCTHFLKWCGDELSAAADRGEQLRLPLSRDPLRRLFGPGWETVLLRAGLAEPAEQEPASAEGAVELDSDFDAAPVTYGPPWATDDLLAWLRFFARRARRSAISAHVFDALSAQFNRDARARGSALRATSADPLKSRYASWPEARAAAALCTIEEAAACQPRDALPRGELLDALAAAITELGPSLSIRGYDAWRDDELVCRADAGERPRLPRADTLAARLGGLEQCWAHAVAETLRCRPRLARMSGMAA